jgi:alanine racemase
MNRVEVDFVTIQSNISEIIRHSDKQIMCVVKSNAYGHGLEKTVNSLFSQGINRFSTYYLHEALKIKKIIPHAQVLHLGPIFSDPDIELLCENDIDLTITSIDQLRNISEKTRVYSNPLKVHLKIDTGLSRNGIHYSDFDKLKSEVFSILEHSNLDCVGVMSHLMMSDKESKTTAKQIQRFETVCHEFSRSNISVKHFHLGNTSYLFHKSDQYSNMVRIGIGIYGLSCGVEYHGQGLDIKPAMSFTSRVISTKTIRKGDRVSYGGKFTADSDMRIAVVAAGYADGIPRTASKEAYVTISGQKCSVLGVVCMNNFTIDITDIKDEIDIGEVVTIFSNGEFNSPTADDWGAWSNSIGYEVVTNIGRLN